MASPLPLPRAGVLAFCCALGRAAGAAGPAAPARWPAAPLRPLPALGLEGAGRVGEVYSDLVVSRDRAAAGNGSLPSTLGRAAEGLLPKVVLRAGGGARAPALGAGGSAPGLAGGAEEARLVEMGAVYLDLVVRDRCTEDRCWQGRPGAAGLPGAGPGRPEREVPPASKKLRPVSFELREHAGARLLARADTPAPMVKSLRSLGLRVGAR